MTDRELLEYIAAQFGKLTQDVGKLSQDVGKLTQGVGELKEGQKDITQRVIKVETILENDINTKLEALLVVDKQNAEKIDRIEKEVTKQEEIIMRRVK